MSWVSTEGDLTNKNWVVTNCCEDSCGKQAILNGYACPTGSSKDPGFWTSFGYFRNLAGDYVSSSDITSNDTFASKCCYMSCDSVNGTSVSNTCGFGKVENLNKWAYEDKQTHHAWYQARGSISDFQSTCCVDATCNNIVNQYNFRGRTCEDVYGLSYSYSYGNEVLSDYSDPLPCCSGVDSDCKPMMSEGSRCPNGTNYASWVSSSITVTSDNFQDNCCKWTCSDANVNCGDLFPSNSWTGSQYMSDFNNKESVCCANEWQCDIYPSYKRWDSIYTSRSVSETTYQLAFVEVFPSTYHSENTYQLWSRFLKYDDHVTQPEWIEKCMCPSTDLGCLEEEMKNQDLVTTCKATGYDCSVICGNSVKNTGCDVGFTHISEFDTKLWGGQLAEGPEYYAKNRFMERCCERNDGEEWAWDWSI